MSWAQIVSSINSNLSRTLDQQISDRFNQVDARLNTLESQLTTASSTITNSSATSDKVLERVSAWMTVASDNVRDGQDNVHAVIPGAFTDVTHNVFEIGFSMPGTYRITVNLRSAAGPAIVFAGITRATTGSGGGNQIFNISISGPVFPIAHWLGFRTGVSTATTVIFDLSICYDIVEIPPKRPPFLTRIL